MKTSPDRVLAIDLGLDNLAACVTNTGTSFLMDGRKLKSINQYWNKRKARLQSIAAKQGQKTTNQLCQLAKKRHFRMQDILRKTARYILDFCISHQIGTIVCGYNRDFKRGLKLGKVTNQHFTQISLSYLRSTLKQLCERYGITYLEQEESIPLRPAAWIWTTFPYTSRIHPIQERSAETSPARPVPLRQRQDGQCRHQRRRQYTP